MQNKPRFYKVGGYVRDKLLGIKSQDIDYVVVGATVSDMIEAGFIPVGKEFPVFIHPKTKAEYALARTEKKDGHGYHGFQFYTSPSVTLEEDLKRRDITINAIAEDSDGNLIDPFNGIRDLNNKVIRHVSSAFIEDPLRVIRVARFSAKFGFKISPKTKKLMMQIVKSGELKYISKERIWSEIKKALLTNKPLLFFKVLYQSNALKDILPQLEIVFSNKNLYSTIKYKLKKPQNKLEMESEENIKLTRVIAIICGSLTLFNYEHLAIRLIKEAILPKEIKSLVVLVITNVHAITDLEALNDNQILELITKLDALRQPKRFSNFCNILVTLFKRPQKTNIKHNLQIIQDIINKFKRIDYQNLKSNLNDKQFLPQLKTKKLEIINKIRH